MSLITKIAGFLDDRVSPIVVKELRQAVRGRLVVGILLLFLFVQLCAIGIFVISQELSGDRNFEMSPLGKQSFSVMLTIMLMTCILAIPGYTGTRLGSERSESNVDLLFITTLKPHSIVLGKLAAGAILTAFIFSACTPFIVFTYFLRGIDLRTIVTGMTAGFVAVTMAIIFAIFVASLPGTRPLKALAGLFFFIVTTSLLPASIAFFFGGGRRAIGGGLVPDWLKVVTIIVVVILLAALLLVLSIARFTPPAANRALPVRLTITAIWFIGGSLALVWALFTDADPLIFWGIVMAALLTMHLLVAAGERDRLGPRVTRTIPPPPRRLLAFLFYSGAGSGIFWTAVMMTLTVVFLMSSLTAVSFNLSDVRRMRWIGEFCGYVLCYILSAIWLQRRPLHNLVRREHTWAIAILLLCAGSILPPMIGYFGFRDSDAFDSDSSIWLMFNPFPQSEGEWMVARVTLLVIWGSIVLALNLPWLIEQYRNFRPNGSKPAPDVMVAEGAS